MAKPTKSNERRNLNEDYNEKNVLIHALKYLNENDYPANANSMFENMIALNKIGEIEATLTHSGLFNPTKKDYYTHFELLPQTKYALSVKSPEELVSEMFHEREMQKQEKGATRKKLWYESEEAEKRFYDYPTTKCRAKWSFIIAAISLGVSMLTIVLEWKCPKPNPPASVILNNSSKLVIANIFCILADQIDCF